MAASRSHLKCITTRASALVLLIVGYFGSAPLVGYFVAKHVPALQTLMYCVYFPTEYYFQRDELPGSNMYRAYGAYCQEIVDKLD